MLSVNGSVPIELIVQDAVLVVHIKPALDEILGKGFNHIRSHLLERGQNDTSLVDNFT
jgi:hypothetical protein